jgi:hypothetical protein
MGDLGIPTWVGELAVVAAVLGGVLLVTGAPWFELVGSCAVLASFAHGQVSDRLAEREAARTSPEVHCHAWARRYFLSKEALWLVYFVAKGAWSAFVGCAVFLAYPAWRTWWRRRSPLRVSNPTEGS